MSASRPITPPVPRAFTLVELLVASVVMSIALLGIHAVFQQVLRAEGGASVRSRQRAAARAVVEHLAESLEQALILPDIPAIRGEWAEDGGAYVLTCVCGAGLPAGAIQWRRYTWHPPGDAAGSGVIAMQVLHYAGTRRIGPLSIAADEASESEPWAQVDRLVVAHGVDLFRVEFRTLDQADARWQDRWSGQGGRVLVKLRVQVGLEAAERLVMPPVDAALDGGTEG